MYEAECKQCSKKFYDSKHTDRKYCSRSCFFESRRKSVKVKCKNCEVQFDAQLCRVIKGEGIYCSSACQHIGRRNSVSSNCLLCGKEFKAIMANVRKGWGKYCSRSCQVESMKNKIECICKKCETTFLVHPSTLKNGRGKFCSWECWDRYKGCSELEITMARELNEMGILYDRQRKFWKYHADFFIPHLNLVIECDDRQHTKPKNREKDIRRDKWFADRGYRTVRITHKEIIENPREVLLRKIPQFK